MTTPRLLPVQQNYLEGIKILIDIYYLLKSLDKKLWFSEKPIKMIASLFTLTISNFTQSVFYGDGCFYHLRYGKKDTEILINEAELKKFLQIVDNIYTETLNSSIKNTYHVIKATTSVDYLPVQNKQLKKLGQDLYFPTKKITKAFKCKIYDRKDPWYLNGEFNSKIYDKIHSDLNQLPCLQEVFNIDINLDSSLHYSLSSFDSITASEHDNIVVSPQLNKKTTLSDAIRYIMAKFYTLFGSFNRIKVCLNENCKKLIIEKKYEAKLFCNKECRMIYNAYHQPREIRLCRERQNQWLRNKLNGNDISPDIAPDHVHKEHCNTCKKVMKSGLCSILIKRNSKAIREINKCF